MTDGFGMGTDFTKIVKIKQSNPFSPDNMKLFDIKNKCGCSV